MLKSVFKILPLRSFVVCLCKGNITNAIGNHKGHINLYLMLINNMFQNSMCNKFIIIDRMIYI